jgi:CheY-like chemotaxis protein
VLILGVDEQRDGLILIVEDDEATKGFLADNLAADGFRVASAASAAEGLRAIEVRRPALVLLDLRLEGSSGLDVLDRVRAADGLASRIDPDLPVIVLTGRAGEADRVRSFDRGADDHVSKPSFRFPRREIPLVDRASNPVGALDADVVAKERDQAARRRLAAGLAGSATTRSRSAIFKPRVAGSNPARGIGDDGRRAKKPCKALITTTRLVGA